MAKEEEIKKWQESLFEAFAYNDVLGGRYLRPAMGIEKLVGSVFVDKYRGHRVLTDAFMDFLGATIWEQAEYNNANGWPQKSPYYVTCLLMYLTMFRSFRAAELLSLHGYPLQGYVLQRSLKDQAYCLCAAANGMATFGELFGWEGHKPPPKKQAVTTLVEREGRAMSFHVANVTAKTLRPIIVKHASRASHLMTDENLVYVKLGREFAGPSAVNHSVDEYVRLGGFAHTNTAENFFSILKRGVYGVYHHVSEAHLHRYLVEFDFRYNTRAGLGVTDTQRAALAIKGAAGKRLYYRGPRQTASA